MRRALPRAEWPHPIASMNFARRYISLAYFIGVKRFFSARRRSECESLLIAAKRHGKNEHFMQSSDPLGPSKNPSGTRASETRPILCPCQTRTFDLDLARRVLFMFMSFDTRHQSRAIRTGTLPRVYAQCPTLMAPDGLLTAC